MKCDWLDEYLLSKPGAIKDYKIEWEWHRYLVGGKMFAATMHPSCKYDISYADKDLINLKCEPLLSELMQKEYSEVLPGFYADKRTWISVVLEGNLPDDVLRDLCDRSFQLVFGKLTKKLQKEILEAHHDI